MLPLVILDTHILRRALFDASNPDDDPDGKLAAEARQVLRTVWAKCYTLIYTSKLDDELAGRVIRKHGQPHFDTVIRELKQAFWTHGKLREHSSKKSHQAEFSDFGEDWHLLEAASSVRDRPVLLITREKSMLQSHISRHPDVVIKPPWDFNDEAGPLKDCVGEPLPV